MVGEHVASDLKFWDHESQLFLKAIAPPHLEIITPRASYLAPRLLAFLYPAHLMVNSARTRGGKVGDVHIHEYADQLWSEAPEDL